MEKQGKESLVQLGLVNKQAVALWRRSRRRVFPLWTTIGDLVEKKEKRREGLKSEGTTTRERLLSITITDKQATKSLSFGSKSFFSLSLFSGTPVRRHSNR
ncbi:hypothetical protein CIPAW_02G057600 [Carya illinoinensis]|uniref:Uncharacterized protein n=1 Tax=Carya illinoinensis TaxID=32201 RepID=A0A8T1RAN1_CARIL|nr:hypothetical protein CIPAW_02G057600 [Carya illinoinensis]